jgi:carboxyl-terminal processing protease
MKRRIRHAWILCLVFSTLGLLGGIALGCQLLAFTPSRTIPPDATSNFQLMAEAWNTIQRFYVDRTAVKAQLMTYGAIGGMVDSLGDTDHSRFLTPEMVKQERNFAKGELEGIGAEVQKKNNQVVIVAPFDGSPAQRAGLKPGDIILKVDGEDVSGLPLGQAVSRILGPPGSTVKLAILNPKTRRIVDVTIVRARITLHSVKWLHLPDTGVADVRIAAFNKGVTQDLKKALLEIQQAGLTGLILDLRNNPGGLLEEAVATASQFLRTGNVMLEKNAAGRVTPVAVREGGIALRIPMVVLINGGTSSGAEIVAGALQDARRAELVGEKTFGTGTVLESFSLSDGSAVLLAIEEWLTPAGRVIWHQGISPNVLVSLPPDITLLIPEAGREMTPAQLRASGDEQLLKALDLLSRPRKKQAHHAVGKLLPRRLAEKSFL